MHYPFPCVHFLRLTEPIVGTSDLSSPLRYSPHTSPSSLANISPGQPVLKQAPPLHHRVSRNHDVYRMSYKFRDFRQSWSLVRNFLNRPHKKFSNPSLPSSRTSLHSCSASFPHVLQITLPTITYASLRVPLATSSPHAHFQGKTSHCSFRTQPLPPLAAHLIYIAWNILLHVVPLPRLSLQRSSKVHSSQSSAPLHAVLFLGSLSLAAS